jgi:hypothetical protein
MTNIEKLQEQVKDCEARYNACAHSLFYGPPAKLALIRALEELAEATQEPTTEEESKHVPTE